MNYMFVENVQISDNRVFITRRTPSNTWYDTFPPSKAPDTVTVEIWEAIDSKLVFVGIKTGE